MAENKQYITTRQGSGTVLISEDVIATIVAQALKDVNGVVGLNTRHGGEFADLIGKKSWAKGMKVYISENNSVTIDCNLVIGYGQSVVAIAQNVQEVVSAAVESIAGVRVTAVNVNICGIMRQ